MTPELYKEITAWQDATFTKATALSCANHLKEECGELIESILVQGQPCKKEIADCFMLLIDICNKYGLSWQDVVNLVESKFRENQNRK